MKIVTWNVRGLNGAKKGREVHDMIHRLGIDLLFIQETKMDYLDSEQIKKIGGSKLQGWCFKPAEGLKEAY